MQESGGISPSPAQLKFLNKTAGLAIMLLFTAWSPWSTGLLELVQRV